MKLGLILSASGILLAVWLLASLVIHFARDSSPTAEKIENLILSHDWEKLTPTDRSRALDQVTTAIVRLDSDQREQLRTSPVARDFYLRLERQEQLVFLEKTLPSGFSQMMDAINKMPREERQRIVRRAVRNLRESRNLDLPEDVDEDTLRLIIDQGLKSFFADSSNETKLDLAPFIEELQRTIRMSR